MNVRSDLAMAYHMGYEDALAKRMPDATKAGVLNSYICTDNERAEAERLREELADAPKCEACEAMLDCDECLRADGSHKERRRLSAENAKLRELLDYMTPIAWYAASEREREHMRELEVEVPK